MTICISVPLNPLRVFEAAARLGSFKLASADLGVTASAVSRQVSALEGYIGARLFSRRSMPLTLTPLGAAYFEGITESLGNIYTVTSRIRAQSEGKTLNLVLYPTFAVKWFMPRISKFYSRSPDVSLNIVTSFDPYSESARNGALTLVPLHREPPLHSVFLFKDYIQPFCTRNYRDRHELHSVEQLSRAKLLRAKYRMNDWNIWFRQAGVSAGFEEHLDYLDFPLAMLAYRAAAEGLGVIMGQISLLEDEISSGALIPLFNRVDRGSSYYLLNNGVPEEGHITRRFTKWIQEEARDMARKLSIHQFEV
jgi:LysR family glycine cleavage system transcriptional activator